MCTSHPANRFTNGSTGNDKRLQATSVQRKNKPLIGREYDKIMFLHCAQLFLGGAVTTISIKAECRLRWCVRSRNVNFRWRVGRWVTCILWWNTQPTLCDSFVTINLSQESHLTASKDQFDRILGPVWDPSGTRLGPVWDPSGTRLGPVWDP